METTARGDVPKTLHNIAFVSIPESADLEFLLWDLQDAIAAYARLSDTVLPHPVDLKADDAGAVDGIVLAVDDAFDDEAMIAVEQILDRLGNTETRVYVVVQALSNNAKQTDEVLDRLYRACLLRDLPWCDGVVVCTGTGIAALRHSRAWVSCVGHFRKRWISLWAPYAWAAPLSMRSCLAVAMPEASMPTAWCASSPRCPHRSGMPS